MNAEFRISLCNRNKGSLEIYFMSGAENTHLRMAKVFSDFCLEVS